MDKMFTKAAKLLPPNIQKIYGGDGGQWVGLKAIYCFLRVVCGRVVGCEEVVGWVDWWGGWGLMCAG